MPQNDPAVINFTSLEIKANYTCNTKCIYCCGKSNWQKRVMTFDEIAENVRYFMDRHQIAEVCLSGGEPTIHPDFLQSLNLLREQKLRAYLHTNAIRLADRQFALKCSGFIDRVLVGFSYHNEQLCAALTGTKGTLGKRFDGIRNLQEISVPVRTNTVIMRENLQYLQEIAELISTLGIQKALFTLPFFFMATPAQVERFVPGSLEEVKQRLAPALALLQSKGIQVALQGLPPCKIDEFAGLYEIDPDRAFVDSEHQRERHTFLFSGMLGYGQNEECADCGLKAKCWGFPRSRAMGALGDRLGLS
jgi:molybdenum cofactor biosynthesis enzyme MoaA